ncbi:asparaginase [Patescibacteria group bacterium]|nr:asparaginase [Patescibacteria group bacterium]MBU4016720.1 asparaginase [Patescibacteria group bacterium]MBU4099001.1 asparaginase [Patescibacteria group bacterium]
MKKILVIGTGGTIAAVKSPEGLRPAYKTDELISFFPEILEIAKVEGKMLFNLDSTNIQPHHWSEIAIEIQKQYDTYDGFVITHGTDTMQYTAAALSFMLQNLSKPIVLTGSVKAIGEKSDARQNFIDSVIVASSGISEVCIVFHGKIIKGCKARKITNEATKITNENLSVYSSINHHLLGEMIGELKDNHTRKIVLEKGYIAKSEDIKALKVLPGVDPADIFAVRIYPGMIPEIFDRLTDFKCVLIEAFGPGNIPFMENSLVEKIDMLTKKGIPVFITSQNPFGEVDMTLYEVGQKALKAGRYSLQ